MIAIPNMSKPKSCKECPFTCEALQFFNGTDIPQSCPLFEIVRCGECSWYEKPSCRWHNIDNKPTDFCSYGERRADGNTD